MRPAESYSDYEGGIWDGNHSDHGLPDAGISEHRDDGASSGASTPRGDPRGGFARWEDSPSKPSGDESERKPPFTKMLSSKAEAWVGKKSFAWPWKEKEGEDSGRRMIKRMNRSSKRVHQLHSSKKVHVLKPIEQLITRLRGRAPLLFMLTAQAVLVVVVAPAALLTNVISIQILWIMRFCGKI